MGQSSDVRLADRRAQSPGSVWLRPDLHRMFQENHKAGDADGSEQPQSLPYGGVTHLLFYGRKQEQPLSPRLVLSFSLLHDFPKLNSLLLTLCRDDGVMGGVGECRVWMEMFAVW